MSRSKRRQQPKECKKKNPTTNARPRQGAAAGSSRRGGDSMGIKKEAQGKVGVREEETFQPGNNTLVLSRWR